MSEARSQSMGFPRLDYYEVTSTLDIAREQASRGAPHGTLVTAIHQTAGRGRRGAAWHDSGNGDKASGASCGNNESDEANALLTFILRVSEEALPLREAWRVPFIASLACCKALREFGFAETQLKWPNDLVIGGRKTGGLLVESIPSGESIDRLAPLERVYLLGIGINVGQTRFPSGGSYALEPTSLRLEAKETVSVPNATQVTSAVAVHLARAWSEHLGDGAALIEAWRAYQITGQVQTGIDIATGKTLAGRYLDVRSSDGAALVSVGEDGGGATAALMPTG